MIPRRPSHNKKINSGYRNKNQQHRRESGPQKMCFIHSGMSRCVCLLSEFRVGGASTAFRPITTPDMIFLCTPSCPGPSRVSLNLQRASLHLTCVLGLEASSTIPGSLYTFKTCPALHSAGGRRCQAAQQQAPHSSQSCGSEPGGRHMVQRLACQLMTALDFLEFTIILK